jgi:mono/diheme cytochrome c family protein
MMLRMPGLLPALVLASLSSPVSAQDTPAGGSADWKAPASAAELRNPYAGTENHGLAGKKLYQRYCSSCHGKDAGGAARIPALTSDKVRGANEGRLFWYVRNGNSRAGMPGWSRLPDQQIWQLVTFLQVIPEK